jgi:predicted ATPase with chaperone activity
MRKALEEPRQEEKQWDARRWARRQSLAWQNSTRTITIIKVPYGRPRSPAFPLMLFKTISASVYGIDAYLVEVEVDVGSARMEDFNVVGLPDNAVKESRQRVKAALKNCGFEFPYGQGVTINLAPADLRKEGSAFDLPMALGLLGCQGQFFGKALDKMMFLGELSLDGGVRPVRGALSATIAAEGEKLLENAVTRLGLSARAHDRILKVARTIADLEGAAGLETKHLSEAIQYRTLDRSYWA